MTHPSTAFSGLDDMLDLGHRDGIDMRPTLLRVLTDLYLQRPTHTPEDERYYTELVLRLIDATDVSQRTALAERLAACPSAPPPVIERLARDVIEVAGPVLAHSPCLTRAVLEAIAQERGGAHAETIAARAPGAVPEVPAASLADTAEAAELSEIFFAAGTVERRLILISLDYATITPSQPPCAVQLADAWRLETAALKREVESVARELERALGISRDQARRIVNDELGEPIVAAARAINLPAEILQRILLFLNPHIGQSVDRVYELAELYREISTDAARRLVAIWRDADRAESRPPQRETVAWRTAADNARRALSEVSRRTELAQDWRLRSGTR